MQKQKKRLLIQKWDILFLKKFMEGQKMSQTCSTDECESNKCCESKKESQECCSGNGCGSEKDNFTWLLYLAKKAKMELLKEKLKKKLEATHGKKLDKIADVLVEALLEKHKMDSDVCKKKSDLRERFESIINEE
jgi:hypothetical protein